MRGQRHASITPLPEGEPWTQGSAGHSGLEGSTAGGGAPPAPACVPDVVEILVEGADGQGSKRFARSLPLSKALHPDTLLALEMNGAPLTKAHGAPVRLLVPGWYGMASVKWVSRIEALTRPFAATTSASATSMTQAMARPPSR